ncbi:hypothetical protein ES288_D13G065900v1 [Gossypium darwinii]|uniref:Uncharacterized protein n=1 Tax=Gossypium darwinii TaxID=34276 RepID=A0A5D1ZWF3_GOSDA|nr:hypothetical protein ES288_D13G065900v1 [Gossypium darwinii]
MVPLMMLSEFIWYVVWSCLFGFCNCYIGGLLMSTSVKETVDNTREKKTGQEGLQRSSYVIFMY